MKLRQIHDPKARHDVNSPNGVRLRDLAAYRLLRHFKGNWKAAQTHVENDNGGGYPYWRGKKEWFEAAQRAEAEIVSLAQNPPRNWQIQISIGTTPAVLGCLYVTASVVRKVSHDIVEVDGLKITVCGDITNINKIT